MNIRTLIVDDERLARQRIKSLLEKEPDLELVGECSNGMDAVTAIRKLAPDLIFLDVQMPEVDGFGVLKQLDPTRLPVIVFVTAYDQHALRAFEVHATDYLLKPFDRDRFRTALQRARSHIRGRRAGDLNERLLALLEGLQTKKQWLERLVVKSAGRVFFLRTEEIDWIDSAGNYVRLHLGKEIHLLRDTLSALSEKLDSNRFLRINRSTVVNLERVKELRPWFHGDYVILLRDGTRMTSSRGYREPLKKLLGKTG